MRGAVASGFVLGAAVGLGHALAFVPNGPRAQAVGVAVTTLFMLLAGFGLALLASHAGGVGGLASLETEKVRSRRQALLQAVTPWHSAPWQDVIATSVGLAILGLLSLIHI